MSLNNKFCAIAYTGGNSHLALIKAVELGYIPSCLTFWEGGLRHRINFADISRLEIIKTHAEMLKTGFFVYKPDEDFHPKKPFLHTKKCISSALNYYYANTLVMGYSADTEYPKEIFLIKKACQEKSFKLLLPLLKFNTRTLIEEYIKMKVKMMVVAVNRNFPWKWLGKIIDEKFINFMENSQKKGKPILKPDFQVLAVKSPLLAREMKVLTSEVIEDKNGYYLDIKRFTFRS